jgi:hypothetical protein
LEALIEIEHGDDEALRAGLEQYMSAVRSAFGVWRI